MRQQQPQAFPALPVVDRQLVRHAHASRRRRTVVAVEHHGIERRPTLRMTQLQAQVTTAHGLPRGTLETRLEDRWREGLAPGTRVAKLLREVERVVAVVELTVGMHERLEAL